MGFICSFLPGLLDFSISNLHLYVSYETNVILHSQTRRPGALFLLLYNNTPTQHTGTFLTIGLFRTCLNKPGITLSVLGKSIKKHCEKMETHNYMIFAGCHINMNAGQLVALFLIALLDRPSSYFAVLWVEILVSSGYVLCFSATLDLQNSRSFSTLSLTLIPELLHRIYQNRLVFPALVIQYIYRKLQSREGQMTISTRNKQEWVIFTLNPKLLCGTYL